MKRFLTVLLLSGAVWAQPPVVSDSSATAQGDVRRPVIIDVTVENRGKEASKPARLFLVCTPQVRGKPKNTSGVPTITDPVMAEQALPELKPGEKKVLQFQTGYESKNNFKNVKRNFKASNIDPTGQDVLVDFQAQVR